MKNQEKHYPRKSGIKRIFAAFNNSIKGLNYLLKEEAAFIQEFSIALILIPIILFIDNSLVEKLFLFLSLMLVIITEILNTAIERTVDRIGLEHHNLSGLAKDLGSLAVLLSIITAVVVWLVIIL
jgi:diacylglycerol kinase (ATP)